MVGVAEPEESKLLLRVAKWLNRVGLRTTPGVRFEQPFNAGIWIEHGCLVFDPEEAHPGDLLHEAGHVAVLPGVIRTYAMTDLGSIEKLCDKYMEEHPDGLMGLPEDPVMRAILQSGDQEAIAWSYAAAKASRVDPWLTCVKGFGTAEQGEGVFRGLKAGQHPGINGLRASGFIDSVKDFPKLKKWTVD